MTFKIPAGVLAQHIAVLGKTGSGKSYAVRGLVEGLLDSEARVCVIDPTGAWHGLRSSATGKSAGYPVVIFGGAHADLTLAAQYGEAIAETIGTSSTPAIIDTSLMRVGERTRFFADFADALIRKNKGPLHLVIDEAHLFAPQGKVNSPQAGEMLSAANNLVSLGRSRGLRVIMITQRPAKLHKDSLTQCETMIAMRLIAPQDRNAVREWIEDNADKAKGQEIISSLATLKTGQGWIWAPELGILERVSFPKIKTFDSGRAPDGTGEQRQVMAPIDVNAVSEKLKSVKAEAIANDPAALKKRIAELERITISAAKSLPADVTALDRARQEGYTAGIRRGWEDCADLAALNFNALREKMLEIGGRCNDLIGAITKPPRFDDARPENPVRRANTAAPQVKDTVPAPARARQIDGRASSSEIGTGGKRRILTALAQYPDGMNQRKLSILVDIAPKGGTWRTYMADMRGKGWIDGGRDHLRITDAGLDALGAYEPLPTGAELVEYWRRRLGDSGKRAIFDAVVQVYPNAIDVDEVSQITGIARAGGTWRTYLADLRGLGLVEGRDELKASKDLFQ